MEILQKLHENEEARKVFQDLLMNLRRLSEPEVSDATLVTEMAFESYLDALIHLKRKDEDVEEGNVRIGHWCCMESEKDVEGMKSWPVYWLTISLFETVPVDTMPVVKLGKVVPNAVRYTELELSLWASGKDDNTIQKGIKAWVECHFPIWEIKKLRCVRR